VTKDFRSLTRRREMLPLLVVPFVIFVITLVENVGAGSTGSSISHLLGLVLVGWAGGFLALLLATTSVGQERRAMQTLYAAPITGRTVFRAKVASVLIPALLVTALVVVAGSVVYHASALATAGMVVVATAAATAVGLWGLAFAARYSDFQDRPRPQYLRPSAMLAASVSGMVVLFGILIPGAFAVGASDLAGVGAAASATVLALVFGTVGWYFARSGFDRLLTELPF
jgi:hypothetical protein